MMIRTCERDLTPSRYIEEIDLIPAGVQQAPPYFCLRGCEIVEHDGEEAQQLTVVYRGTTSKRPIAKRAGVAIPMLEKICNRSTMVCFLLAKRIDNGVIISGRCSEEGGVQKRFRGYQITMTSTHQLKNWTSVKNTILIICVYFFVSICCTVSHLVKILETTLVQYKNCSGN